jgi:hypothetical protein
LISGTRQLISDEGARRIMANKKDDDSCWDQVYSRASKDGKFRLVYEKLFLFVSFLCPDDTEAQGSEKNPEAAIKLL